MLVAGLATLLVVGLATLAVTGLSVGRNVLQVHLGAVDRRQPLGWTP